MRTGIVALTFLFVLIVAALWTRDIAEAQTSTPAIQTSYYISDGDQRVYVNDTFTIRFSMRRTSGGAGHGGISVSFPGLDQANSSGSNRSYDSPKASVVTDSYTNGSQRVSYFASGYSPIHKADGTQGEAEYLLVETDDTNWPLNTYRTLELEVTPKTTGLLIINYRYWLCGNGYQNCTYGPDRGTVDRQQGWHVDTFRVLVRNRRPAVSRESPQDRRVELRPGDTQTFVAEGTDRDGNLSQVEWYLDDESSGGQSLVPTGEYTDSATHSFPNAGTYRVSVTFTDTIGESGSTYWDVEVSDDIDVTVASDPPRRTITVDGTDRTAPYTTAWDPGTSLTLDAPSPQNVFGVNDRYVFSHWSHGGSQRQTVRPTTDTTYTANFTLQHFLSTRTEPRGIGIAGGGQWYDHGSRARVGPAPTLAGLQFSHWEKGDGEDIGFDPAGVQVTVDAAFLVVAVYTQASVQAPAQVSRIDSLGCAPTTVQVGQTVSCRPELSGGTPTEYDWDAIGGSPSSGAMRNFSTRWDTRGTKRVDFEACNDSGCDGQSQTILVDPGQGACFINWGTLPTGNTSVSGYWDGNCASTHRSGGYGRFYAFTLTQRTRVQIGLASSEDTYLYLLSGADSEGSVVDEDDDGGSTGNNSYLDLTLEAGTYTIEATTYDAGATGDFSLTITVAEVEVFTLTADPPADLHKVAELQAELEKQEAELNKDNPDPPIEIPLLQMLRRVDHTAIFVVETDDADNEYATRFSLAVAGSQDDVTVTITASAEKDITILSSGGLFGTDYNEELGLEGSLTVRTVDAGGRAFIIKGECLAEGGFAVILVEDKDLHMVDEGAILCEQKVIVGIPEPVAACIQALTTVSSPLHGVSPIRGAWTGHCSSEHRGGRYARYYAFTLPPVPPGSSRTVDVTLESFDADAYLYLLEGEGTDGRVIAENDNGPLQASQSQISIPLPGGTYTVEATTEERGVTGEFFLTVSTITVTVPPPLIDSTGCAPLEVLVGEVVTCRPTLSGGEPTRYLWGAIGGDPWSGTDETFSTQWDTPGEKRVVFEACNDAGCDTGEQSITVDAPVPPPPPVALGDPTNLRASSSGPGQVRLTWRPTPGAEVHWLWSVKANSSGGKWTEASGVAGSAIITDLESGQTYWFMVLAGGTVNGAPVWSQWSNRVEFLVADAGRTERFTAISAGVHHTCGVKTDGTLACWGRNDDGQATPREGRFQSVSAGDDYSCGVKNDGELSCWGNNLYGRATPPSGRFVQVSAGNRFACGLREDRSTSCWGDEYNGSDIVTTVPYASVTTGGVFACGLRENGTVVCWTRNPFARRQPPGSQFKSISSGVFHSCGVRDDDTLACWDNTQTDGPIVHVADHGQSRPPAGRFLSVSSGELFSCAVRQDDGGISCWGLGGYGQTMPPAGSFVAVSAGSLHACGLRRDGSVECWGSDDDGRLEPPQDAPATAFASASANGLHSCGLQTDGRVVCWGDDEFGQVPAPDGRFDSVSAGARHNCALKQDGSVVCWGWNEYGQTASPPGPFTSVSAGGVHTCALDQDGFLACWGWDVYGQTAFPQGAFSSVSAGVFHTCGVRASGTPACWGDNRYGQADVPPGGFRTVSAGGYHTCGVKVDGGVSCWGSDEYGQAAAPAGQFTSVSAGLYHSCGVRVGGAVSCWGWNEHNQNEPPEGSFASVSVAWNHTCGLQTDGSVICWGSDEQGQTDAPQVSSRGIGLSWTGEEPFASVSVGSNHTCGVRESGTVTCWGRGSNGESTPPVGRFATVSVGDDYTCGLKGDGSVDCWGVIFLAPSILRDNRFTAVDSSSSGRACGLTEGGQIICWGSYSVPVSSPPGFGDPPPGQFKQISIGAHSCAVARDSTVTCWGYREETRCSWQILPFAEFKLEGTVEATRSLSSVVIKGFVTSTNSGGLRKREYAGQQDLGSMSANSISPFSIATAGPTDFAPSVTTTHGCDYEFEWEP